MIARQALFFGKRVTMMCDANCAKAWGIHNRPRVEISADPDDYAYLADGELPDAPADPGTYEGGHGKPTAPSERLNKWCARECERSMFVPEVVDGSLHELPDLSVRQFNKAPLPAAQGGR